MSKLREVVKDREAWHAAVQWVAKRRTGLSNWTTSCNSPAALPFTPFTPFPHSLLLSCSWCHSRCFPWRKIVSLSFHIFILSVLSCLTLKSLYSSSLPFLPPLLVYFLHFSFSTFFHICSFCISCFQTLLSPHCPGMVMPLLFFLEKIWVRMRQLVVRVPSLSLRQGTIVWAKTRSHLTVFSFSFYSKMCISVCVLGLHGFPNNSSGVSLKATVKNISVGNTPRKASIW